MGIIDFVTEYVKEKSDEYKETAPDHYDMWEEHIKLVYEQSIRLAEKYNADTEIVALGALLHDIALVCKVGPRKEHHMNGATLTKEILNKYNYCDEKIHRVANCVLHHKSSKTAENIEEVCVADGDILAHFANIPMIFNLAFTHQKIPLNEIRPRMKESLEKDFNDLSDVTRASFKSQYDQILNIVLGV